MRVSVLIIFLVFASSLYSLISCRKKEELSANFYSSNVGEKISLRKIVFINDSVGFSCGGAKNTNGAIFKTTNSGLTWQKKYTSNKYSINSIFFLNDSLGYACGDSLTLYKTFNSGNSWTKYTFPNLPWKQYMIPFHALYFFSEDKGFVVGGEHYSKGGLTRTFNSGGEWAHPCFDNEFNCIAFPDEYTAYIGGYGVIYKSTDGGHNFNPCNISGDWYRSLYFFDNNNGFAIGYNGGIYKTTNGGEKWKTINKGNIAFAGRTHYTSLLFADKSNGYITTTNGQILISGDGGNSWNKSAKICNETINSACLSGSRKIVLCSETGNIYFVNLP